MLVEQYINSLSYVQMLVIIVLAFVLVVQLIHYLFVYLRPSIHKNLQFDNSQKPVTVIVCARNESENLRKFLPKVLEQDYQNFEVIVVNDCSEDDSLLVLGELEQKYKHLRHTNIEIDRKFSHGKKLAMTIGVKSAKNEHIVLIDADCYPKTDKWLSSIMSAYGEQTSIVLGYGGYETKKGFLNKIIRYDTITIAMQYMGWAKAGHPYMGVGRNMSYTKTAFFEKNGYQSHYYLMSGDDDLFVNERANKHNTVIVTSKDSQTQSLACTTFSQWVKQKKRHLSTWTHYRFGTKLCLSYELLSRLLFYVAIMVAVYPFELYFEAAIVYLLRLVIQLVVYKKNMNKFGEKEFLFFIPIFDIVLPIFQAAFNILNLRDYRCQ